MVMPDAQHWRLHMHRAKGIMRRYMVTNGFDGALTMLGLMAGFAGAGASSADLDVAIKACLGAAIALFMSGLSSAYLSESAERKKELDELERALISDLSESHYGQASRLLPLLVALVNGLAPLVISLIIILPLWLAHNGFALPASPFVTAIATSLGMIFLLGVLLGRLSREFWLWSGLRALAIAGITAMVIFMLDA